MKKIIIATLCLLASAVVAGAQGPRTIGARLGYGAEFSYQHSLGQNFVEADLGFVGNSGVYVTGVYDFVFASFDNFNAYGGPGVQAGVYTAGENVGAGIGVAGQIGLEYNFAVPFTLSLDWRPVWGFIGYTGFYGSSVAIGARYRF